MDKKTILLATLIVVPLIVLAAVMLDWNGAFNKWKVSDVASFDSPDGSFRLLYQQLGEAEFPFGKTEVRLTVTDGNGRKLDSIDTAIHDDGAMANAGNVKSVIWGPDAVSVILQASEMPDMEIILHFDK